MKHPDPNDKQARWISARQWIAEDALRDAQAELQQQPGLDLCGILVVRGLLTLDQARVARAAVGGASGRRRPTLELGNADNEQTLELAAIPKPTEASARLQRARYLAPTVADTLEAGEALPTEGVVGVRFAGYEILEEVSRGGMGIVVRAQPERGGDPVAMKMLLDGGTDDHAFQRFQREARALEQLRHRSIVRIREVGREGGVPFFTMDLVPGRSLEQLLRARLKGGEGLWPATQTVRVFYELASALTYCHGQGVIHRDIKPANILLEEDGQQPVLVDFGLVKWERSFGESSASAELSRTGEVRGTPQFMSPEQADPNGEYGDVTPKTDVWGLGASLFTCLTGRPPFEGTTTNIYVALLTRDPPRARDIDPSVPAWLDELCAQCLRKPAAERPRMADVKRRLEAGIGDPSGEVSFERERRRPVSLQALILCGVILGLLVAIAALLHRRRAGEQAEAEARRLAGEVDRDLERASELTFEVQRDFDAGQAIAGRQEALAERRREIDEALTLELRRQALLEAYGRAAPRGSLRRDALADERRRLGLLAILARLDGEVTREQLEALDLEVEAWPRAPSGEEGLWLWVQARLAWRHGDFDAAALRYRELIDRYGDRPRPYEELAELLAARGRAAEAAKVIDAAFRVFPAASQRGRLLLLRAELGGEHSAEALAALAGAPSLPASHAERALARSWELDASPRYPAFSDRAGALTSAAARAARAALCVEMRRPATALALLPADLRGLPLPTHARARRLRAQAFADLDQAQEAIAELDLLLGSSLPEAFEVEARSLRLEQRGALDLKAQLSDDKRLMDLIRASFDRDPEDAAELRAAARQALIDEALRRSAGAPTRAFEASQRLRETGVVDRQALQTLVEEVVLPLFDARRLAEGPDVQRIDAIHELMVRRIPKLAFELEPKLRDSRDALDLLILAQLRWGPSLALYDGPIRQREALLTFAAARAGQRPIEVALRLARVERLLAAAPDAPSSTELTRRAEVAARVALQRSPYDPRTSKALRRVFAFTGSPREAFVWATNAFCLDPTDPEHFLYYSETREDEASKRSALDWAIRCEPDSRDPQARAELRLALAEVLVEPDRSAAAALALAAAQIAPHDREVLARALAVLPDDHPEAAGLEAERLRHERDGRDVLDAAQVAFEAGRFEEAVTLAGQCRELLAGVERRRSLVTEGRGRLAVEPDGRSGWVCLVEGSELELAAADALLLEMSRRCEEPIPELELGLTGLGDWEAAARGLCEVLGGRTTPEQRRALDAALIELVCARPLADGPRLLLATLRLLDDAAPDATELLERLCLTPRSDADARAPLPWLLWALAARASGDEAAAGVALNGARERSPSADLIELSPPPLREATRALLRDGAR